MMFAASKQSRVLHPYYKEISSMIDSAVCGCGKCRALRDENHALSSSVEAAWVEYRKMRDENDTFRNKLASSEAIFRSVNNQNADLRESLTQQAAEFENLMAAYKALLESQNHLIGALE